MATLTVRNETPKQATMARPTAPWEPFRVFRNLLEWDPFRTMAPTIDREALSFFPDFDVKETPGEYVFKADMPGVKESDLDVSMHGNRLTIHGKRESEKEEKTETYYACERAYGSFQRAFTLPEGVDADAVNAELKDGVLTVTVAKKPEVQPKKIPIGTQAQKH